MTIGEKIKLIRNSRKLTQEQLAELSGISFGAIKKYELSERNPKPDQLAKIAEALEISVNVFKEIEIKSVSDLFSLLIAMQNQLDISFDADTDSDGKYIPESIKMSFNNSQVCKQLCAYMSVLDNSPSEIANITNIILDDNTCIQKGFECKPVPAVSESTYSRDLNAILIECNPVKQDLILDFAKMIQKKNL